MVRPLYGWQMLFDCGAEAIEATVVARNRKEAWAKIRERFRRVRPIAAYRIED